MSPQYSIIVPAFNEEVWLTKSLPAIHQAMGAVDKPGELIVVDNNSTDATAQVALRHGAKVVFEPINQIITNHHVTTSARKLDQPIRNTLGFLLIVFFPPAIFFRRLCFLWYRSPEIDPAINTYHRKDD